MKENDVKKFIALSWCGTYEDISERIEFSNNFLTAGDLLEE
jgi:hypothetical protein